MSQWLLCFQGTLYLTLVLTWGNITEVFLPIPANLSSILIYIVGDCNLKRFYRGKQMGHVTFENKLECKTMV